MKLPNRVLFDVLMVGVNAALIAIINIHLMDNDTCLLTNDVGNMALCTSSLTVASAGIGIQLVWKFLTRGSMNVFLGQVMIAAYAGSASILTYLAYLPATLDVPENVWRTVVFSLFWGNAGLTLLVSLTVAVRPVNKQIACEAEEQHPQSQPIEGSVV